MFISSFLGKNKIIITMDVQENFARDTYQLDMPKMVTTNVYLLLNSAIINNNNM